ncbi:MAG: hypothetical protein AB7O28_14895 [Vicinamibacterales bacterium]
MSNTKAICLALALTGVATASADAQTIGTFRWQLSPFCNVLSLTIVQQGSFYQLTGTDDGCGSTGVAPVTGTAFVSGSSVIMGFTVISATGGSRQYSATINLTNFSGTWADGDGSGTFAFNPASPAAGSPRGRVERVFAFGQIREDASIRSGSSRVASVTKVSTGRYCIDFTEPPGFPRIEGAVVGLAGSGTQTLFARVQNGQGSQCTSNSAQLWIGIVNSSGTYTDGRFSFVIP